MQDFISDMVDLANHLADEAGGIICPYFRTAFDIETKDDESPVTMADKAVEKRLRSIIQEHRPDDGIIGEEYEILNGKNQYDWVLDPIDGTKSFIAGRPTFGTLIALCENGVPILGIINQPILKERWVGAKGFPTTFNFEFIKTTPCTDISQASIASTDPYYLSDKLRTTLHKNSRMMVWGGDCYSFGLLANGGIDVAIESGTKAYDFAALSPIVEGAGGHICDWNGAPLTIQSDGNLLAVGDIALKDELLDILKG